MTRSRGERARRGTAPSATFISRTNECNVSLSASLAICHYYYYFIFIFSNFVLPLTPAPLLKPPIIPIDPQGSQLANPNPTCYSPLLLRIPHAQKNLLTQMSQFNPYPRSFAAHSQERETMRRRGSLCARPLPRGARHSTVTKKGGMRAVTLIGRGESKTTKEAPAGHKC